MSKKTKLHKAPSYIDSSYLVPNHFERVWVNRQWDLCSRKYPLTILSAGYSWWPKECSYAAIKRDYTGIELVVNGDAMFIQNGRKSIVKPGQVYMLKQGEDEFFTAGSAGFLHKRFIQLGGASLQHILSDTGLGNYDTFQLSAPVQIATVAHEMKKAYRAIAVNKPNTPEELCHIAMTICMELIRCLPERHYPPEVQSALSCIENNLEGLLTIKEMSQAAGVSATTLQNLFREYIHDSPINFFLKRKMEYAQRLLTVSPLRIKQIAYSLGYSNQFIFSKQFKRVMGKSPREFRQNH